MFSKLLEIHPPEIILFFVLYVIIAVCCSRVCVMCYYLDTAADLNHLDFRPSLRVLAFHRFVTAAMKIVAFGAFCLSAFYFGLAIHYFVAFFYSLAHDSRSPVIFATNLLMQLSSCLVGLIVAIRMSAYFEKVYKASQDTP